MRYWDFVMAAPCRDVDPKIFDAVTAETASEGLDYCRTCPLWSPCDEYLKPATTSYDGIAVGAVWKDGQMVAMLRTKLERDKGQ